LSNKKPQHIKSANKSKAKSPDLTLKTLDAYKAAFETCYHGKAITFNRAGKNTDGVPRWNVVIDGDKGARPMTLDEIAEATVMFTR
jgi:hypothetical protein